METLRKGSRGESVKTLQGILHLVQDGIFGVVTEEAVKDFQRANKLVDDGIVGAKTWELLLGTKGDKIRKSKRTINEIIVHCSATPKGVDYTVADIRKWHLQRGFSDVGYHYIVYRNGLVVVGRDVDKIGAHCTNHNAHSIGVCYIGGCATNGKDVEDTRTKEQKTALLNLLKQLKTMYPKAKIIGHRDTSKDLNGNGVIEPFEWIKGCPSFDAQKEYKTL